MAFESVESIRLANAAATERERTIRGHALAGAMNILEKGERQIAAARLDAAQPGQGPSMPSETAKPAEQPRTVNDQTAPDLMERIAAALEKMNEKLDTMTALRRVNPPLEGEDAAACDDENEPETLDGTKPRALASSDRRGDQAQPEARQDTARRPRSAQEREMDMQNALNIAQQDWGNIARNHGIKPLLPQEGESLIRYVRRNCRKFQEFSPNWKNSDVVSLDENTLMRSAEPQIRKDAAAAAYQPSSKRSGLWKIEERDAFGRNIVKWGGSISAFLDQFSLPANAVRQWSGAVRAMDRQR
jgi:hypothetical protein